MSFKYTAFGGDEHFDQVLEVTNDGLTAVVPHLEITPLDATGQPLPDVTVTTAFGTDRGKRVIPSSFTDYDVLKFEGPDASDVEDVRVRISEIEQVSYPD